jgi:UDP-glucose 4-epimerase
MNILLLGGAGFIGKNLVHRLLKTRWNRITVVDNLSTSKINLDEFDEYKNLFEFVEADQNTMDAKDFRKLCVRKHQIYHLASSVGVELIDQEPKKTIFNNVALANKIIPLLDDIGKIPVVYSSTSEIYGNGPTFKEDDMPGIGPSTKMRWAYATSKLMNEHMIRASRMPSTIVRFFNISGPGQLPNYGMVLPRMIEKAQANEDIIVHGDGTQVRSFCHINDCVEALVKASEHHGEIFNIGADNPVSMNQLAERVIDLTGSRSKIVHIPYSEVFTKEFEDVKYRVPNIDKIRKIGYTPKHGLDDIIKDMM